MTTLLLTLMLSAAPAVGLDAEEAAQRLVAPQSAPAARLVPSDFQYRARLMDEKTQLITQTPDLAGPLALFGASMGTAALGVLSWWGFAALGGLSSGGWDMILSVPLMVFAILLSGATVAMGAVGTWLMVKNIRAMQQAQTRIGEIDEQLRQGWPSNAPPAAPAQPQWR